MILANLYRAHGLNENPKLIFDRTLLLNEDGVIPCTPKGIIDYLKHENVDFCGKKALGLR